MVKPTEGPWHVGGGGTIVYDKAGYAIGNTTTYHGRHARGEAQANARLWSLSREAFELLRLMTDEIGKLPAAGNPLLAGYHIEAKMLLAGIEGDEA